MSNIDWNLVQQKDEAESVPLVLAELELEVPFTVTFDRVFQTKNGGIGAEVSHNVPGQDDANLLWLSGSFGASNGFYSLLKAVGDDPDNIEGTTATYLRVPSENSPAGYAHSWRI